MQDKAPSKPFNHHARSNHRNDWVTMLTGTAAETEIRNCHDSLEKIKKPNTYIQKQAYPFCLYKLFIYISGDRCGLTSLDCRDDKLPLATEAVPGGELGPESGLLLHTPVSTEGNTTDFPFCLFFLFPGLEVKLD